MEDNKITQGVTCLMKFKRETVTNYFLRIIIAHHDGHTVFTNTAGFVHKWKIDDALAQKSGTRKTIVTLKGNSYTGDWFDNKKEGEGHQIWSESGKEYNGAWKNDMRHGIGFLWEPINPPAPKPKKLSKFGNSRPTTVSNLGKSRASNRASSPQVLGIIDPAENDNLRLVYEGGWLWDKMHGNGRRYYRNGDVYDGEWRNGERHGFGTMNYSNGEVYEGEWADGKRHGKGVLFYKKDGNRYEGMWSGDKKDGKGTFYYSSKKQKMDGEWLEDICKCGTLSEYEEGEKEREEGGGSTRGSQSSLSLSSPAPALPALTLIDPERILGEQEELVKKMREMKAGEQGEGEDEEEDEEIGEEGGEGDEGEEN